MTELQQTQEGPDAIGFDPPAPLFVVNEENTVITEPLRELHRDMRVGIPNPWSDEESYAIGIVRHVSGEWVLDIGSSLGKLELQEEGWVCVGLARMSAIAQGLALDAPREPKSFTSRLVRRAGKTKRRKK